jgi:hypothetical protein
MPAPTASQLASLARAAVQNAGLKGENAPDLGDAIADTCGAALALFAAQAMIMPGAPAAAPPPPGAGATAGPGNLMPPPAGGPDAGAIEGLASGFLSARGLLGENAPDLAKVIAGAVAEGIKLFTSTVFAAPGITIAGFATAAPGTLMGAAPPAAALEGVANGLCSSNKLQGENAGDLATALGKSISDALGLLMQQCLVMPGIPASPGATAGPGRLM